MSGIGTLPIGVEPIGSGFARATPTVVLGSISSVSSMPMTVTWTYISPVDHPQFSYRVRLLSEDGTFTVYDTGTVESATSSASLDVSLSAGSRYRLAVRASDLYDTSDWDTLTFLYDAATSSFTENPNVGSVYEVGINGTGYMLADDPAKNITWERRVIPLDPQRLATSETPFTESVDRYTFLSWVDWTAGAGQRLADRDTSSSTAFWTSEGINPFSTGSLQLLPDTDLLLASVHAGLRLCVAGGKLYAVTDDGELSALDDPADVTPTVVTITGAGACAALTTDGTNWYYADGANIYRNSTAADPGSAWSASNAEVMAWCSDRLIIARKAGSSTTPNLVATMNFSTGAEATTWTFDEGTDVRSICSGDGYAFWAASRNDRSVIYAWQLGSSDAPFVTFEVPAGLSATAVAFYQGNLMVRATKTTAAGDVQAVIYRGAVSSGRVTPTRVLELDGEGIDHTVGAFAGDDRFVYFSWSEMSTGASGLGCIDLSTGGWAKWLAGSDVGDVPSVVLWGDRTVFALAGTGVIIETGAAGGNDGSVAEGYLVTSLTDQRTTMKKFYHSVSASFDPLPAGAEIEAAYSIDGGVSYVTLSAVADDGAKYASWDIGVTSDSLAMKFTLRHGTTTTPVLRAATVKMHPIGLADQVLVLPVKCSERMAGLNGHVLSAPTAVSMVRALEALDQTTVLVQDIDWPETGEAQTYTVVAVESKRVGVFTPHLNRQTNDYVTTMTLRRAYS